MKPSNSLDNFNSRKKPFSLYIKKKSMKLCIGLIIMVLNLYASENSDKKTSPTHSTLSQEKGEKGRLEYIPPFRGAPSRRTFSGTRGEHSQTETITALAPDHMGLTINSQPKLFWHCSQPIKSEINIVIINERIMSF